MIIERKEDNKAILKELRVGTVFELDGEIYMVIIPSIAHNMATDATFMANSINLKSTHLYGIKPTTLVTVLDATLTLS